MQCLFKARKMDSSVLMKYGYYVQAIFKGMKYKEPRVLH